MGNMKKDFQKAVKAFRDTLPDVTWYLSGGRTEQHRPEFPKAMMTEQQIRKGTATINLGYAAQEKAMRLADQIRSFPPFIAWRDEWDAKIVGVELNPDNRYQIRIKFPNADEINALNQEIAAEAMDWAIKEVL